MWIGGLEDWRIGGLKDYGKRLAGAERFNVSRQRNGEGGPEGGGSSEGSRTFRTTGIGRFVFAFLGPFSVFFHVLFRVAFLESFGAHFAPPKVPNSIKISPKGGPGTKTLFFLQKCKSAFGRVLQVQMALRTIQNQPKSAAEGQKSSKK